MMGRQPQQPQGMPNMAPQVPMQQRPMIPPPMTPAMQAPTPPQQNGLLSMLLGGQGGQALGLLKMLAQGPQSASQQAAQAMGGAQPAAPMGIPQGAQMPQPGQQGGVDYMSLLQKLLGGQQ